MKPIVPIKSTTQRFTEIEDVRHNIALFTDGSCVLVLGVSAVNFGLLSEREQEAMIFSYAQLINSLSFPIQLIIRSQHKDVTAYLHTLEEKEKEQSSPKLAANIHSYRTFVESMVKEREVLDKKFYIVIPFSRIELGVSTSLLFGSKKQGLPYKKDYIYERATTVLLPKRDHVIRLLARLGLVGWQLSNEQLIRFFVSSYNPTVSIPTQLDIPTDPFDPPVGSAAQPPVPTEKQQEQHENKPTLPGGTTP